MMNLILTPVLDFALLCSPPIVGQTFNLCKRPAPFFLEAVAAAIPALVLNKSNQMPFLVAIGAKLVLVQLENPVEQSNSVAHDPCALFCVFGFGGYFPGVVGRINYERCSTVQDIGGDVTFMEHPLFTCWSLARNKI